MIHDPAAHLICPTCGAGDQPYDIDVLRDGKGTRICQQCGGRWLPGDDPPGAGGPYVPGWDDGA